MPESEVVPSPPEVDICAECGKNPTFNTWSELVRSGWTIWFDEEQQNSINYWLCPSCSSKIVQ